MINSDAKISERRTVNVLLTNLSIKPCETLIGEHLILACPLKVERTKGVMLKLDHQVSKNRLASCSLSPISP